MHGDGWELAGRSATFLALSILNISAADHGVSHHSPKHVFPINILYGSDKRDNIEQDIPKMNINEFIKSHSDDHDLFMSAEEMFLEAIEFLENFLNMHLFLSNDKQIFSGEESSGHSLAGGSRRRMGWVRRMTEGIRRAICEVFCTNKDLDNDAKLLFTDIIFVIVRQIPKCHFKTRLDLISCIKAHVDRVNSVTSEDTSRKYTIISQQIIVYKIDGKGDTQQC